MNQKCLDSSAASVEDKKNSSSLPVKRVCLPDQVKNSWRGAGIVCHSCNSFYKTSSRLSSAFIYSLSMEIMSFSSFQIRWVQWNPYFTYLLTRLSSLWYCNYPHYCMQRNYKENSQTFRRRYVWSLFFKLISVFLHVAPPALICWPSFPCTVDGIDFVFPSSEINHINDLMPCSNPFGYPLLENWWVKWLQCLACGGLREFLASPKSIWSGTQVLEIFLATSVTEEHNHLLFWGRDYRA